VCGLLVMPVAAAAGVCFTEAELKVVNTAVSSAESAEPHAGPGYDRAAQNLRLST